MATTKKAKKNTSKRTSTPRNPKTTRPVAENRRPAQARISAAQAIGKKLDAVPDRIDLRDWFYQPRLVPLPDRTINCDDVPGILDQGTEGACTGFALAAVINFLLRARGLTREVSSRMLYELARRYDEWPGDDYEGSSARGAMKGWVRHGVCSEASWPATKHGVKNFTPKIAEQARGVPGGAFYRIEPRNIRDIHAALNEVGIVYVTLMVHSGWSEPGPKSRTITYANAAGSVLTRKFPIIERGGNADGGHAVALVGYTEDGFIIQNSWGDSWGVGGYALLPYEDFLIHGVDVWVAQLGVPITVESWDEESKGKSGLQRAAESVPLGLIRPFIINVGNNGELSDSGDYWTTETDLKTLFSETIPKQMQNWSGRRVMLYLHGGLVDERAVAARVIAFRDICLANEIYPLHIMWETGAGETLRSIIADLFTNVDTRAGGVGDWLRKMREHLVEARDRTFEITTSKVGTAMWDEMKENARIASAHPDNKGGMQLVMKYAQAAIKALKDAGGGWELHIVGHSAGSIFAAHALPALAGTGIPIKSVQFMAPAITVALFKQTIGKMIEAGDCPIPTNYILSDVGERDDTVGPVYGKSLLYLVSNAFERWPKDKPKPNLFDVNPGVPLVGMQRFISPIAGGDNSSVDPEMEALFNKKLGSLPSLVVAGVDMGDGCRSTSSSHGGFDNDPATLNSILFRILGRKPNEVFNTRELQFGSVLSRQRVDEGLMPGVPLRRRSAVAGDR